MAAVFERLSGLFTKVPSFKFPTSLTKLPPTQVESLSNGLRVATEEGSGNLATIGVFVKAGCRNEGQEVAGTSSVLGQMILKGSKNTPQKELERRLRGMGGRLTTYTNREQTIYLAQVFKEDVEKTVGLLGDILQNPSINEADLEAEKDRQINRINLFDTNVADVVFDKLNETAYQTSGLGVNPLGTPEGVKELTTDHLKEYHKSRYTGPQMVIAGSGAVTHEQLVKFSQKSFSTLSNESGFDDKARYIGSDIKIWNEHMPYPHVAVAVQGAPWDSPDSVTLMLMQQILGSWDKLSSVASNSTSVMCNKLAKYGLAYSATAFNQCYRDTGLFGVYLTCDPHVLNDAVQVTMDSMVRLCFHTTSEELLRAKNQLKTNLLAELDGTDNVCEDIGKQVLAYGRRLTPAELFARIDAVDVDTVKKTAMKYIYDKDPVMSCYGPLAGAPAYSFIRGWTYWLTY